MKYRNKSKKSSNGSTGAMLAAAAALALESCVTGRSIV